MVTSQGVNLLSQPSPGLFVRVLLGKWDLCLGWAGLADVDMNLTFLEVELVKTWALVGKNFTSQGPLRSGGSLA